MYNIYESIDSESQRQVYGSPDNWEINGELLWPPPDSRNIDLFRKSKTTPGENWQRITSYKLLAKGIPTFKAMKAKERMYEKHSDSESAAEAEKLKALKRRHPVNSNTDSLGLPDLSSDFELISAKRPAKAKSNGIVPIRTASSSVTVAKHTKNSNILSNFDDRNMLLGSSKSAGTFLKDLPMNFNQSHLSKNAASVIGKQASTKSSLENPEGTTVESNQNSSKKATIISVDIVNNACTSEHGTDNGTEDPASSVLNIMNLPIDFLNDLPTLSEAYLSDLCSQPTGTTIENFSTSNDLSELRQYLQPPLDQVNNAWNDYEVKLSNVEKRLEVAETHFKLIEANQDALKSQNENLLKLVAALHVKIDGSLNREIHQPTRKKNIPADVQKLMDDMPVQNKPQFGEFLRAYKNKIDLKEALFEKLKRIGGADEEQCTKRTLAALFSDDLLMEYTWFETSKKDPFKDYKVHDLIKECVRVHYAGMTDANYQLYVQDHLKYAFSRVERRYYQ